MADKKDTTKIEIDGLKLEVDNGALDDIEVLDMLDEINEGNPFKVKKLLVALIGKEAWNDVAEHLRGEDGRVSASATAEFMVSVMEAIGAKNS